MTRGPTVMEHAELKGKIVFASGKEGDYDLWRLDLPSGKLTQLTTGNYWNDTPR